MTINVKAGTPSGVHRDIPGTSGKDDVKEFDETEGRSHPNDVTELVGRGKSDVSVKAGGLLDHLKDFPTARPILGHARERVYTDERAENFQRQMEEGFSPGETNQVNPFEFPAVESTKPRTLSEAVQEVTLRFKLMMVACWLPKDYRVLPPKGPVPNPMTVDLSRELKAIATKLWDSYEPRLGAHHRVTVLQVEAPPEEDE